MNRCEAEVGEQTGRPKRKCMKKSSLSEVKQPTRAIRQSARNKVKSSLAMPEPPTVLETEIPPTIKEDISSSGKKLNKRETPAVEILNEVQLNAKTASPAVLKGPSAATKNNSPSVRERANAYEAMLHTKKTQQSPSPLKTKKALTPSFVSSPRLAVTSGSPSLAVSGSPRFTAATIASQAKASPRASPRISSGGRSSEGRQSRTKSKKKSSRKYSAVMSLKRVSASSGKVS